MEDPYEYIRKILTDERLDELISDTIEITEERIGVGNVTRIPFTLQVGGLSRISDAIGDTISMMMMVVGNLPPPGEERAQMMRMAGRAALDYIKVPIVVISISEAWTVQVPPEEMEDFVNDFLEAGKDLDNIEERQELIMINALTVDGRTRTAGYQIIRGPDDEIFLGEELPPAEEVKLHLLSEFYFGIQEAVDEMRAKDNTPKS